MNFSIQSKLKPSLYWTYQCAFSALLAGLFLASCSQQSPPNMKENDRTPTQPRQTFEPFTFSTQRLTPQEHAAILEESNLVSNTYEGITRYNVNTRRGPEAQPLTPVIHPYHHPFVQAPVVVQLPEPLKVNIPESIKVTLRDHAISQIDVFFTPQADVTHMTGPQNYDGSFNINSLKPGYWMFPDRPDLDNIRGPLVAQFQGNVLLSLFEADHFIDNQVVQGELRPFGMSFHDGRVSPDTGHIETEAAHGRSFSFYSLAIFEREHRAAVTLHWLLTEADAQALLDLCRISPNLDVLVHQISQHPCFQETPMWQKLASLVRPPNEE